MSKDIAQVSEQIRHELADMLQNNDFTQKTLIVADRGFESYNLIAHLLEKPHTDFLIRVKQNPGAMREIARLPMLELDCNIAFTITTTQTNEDKQKRHIFLQIPKKSREGAKTRRGRWDFPAPYPMRLRICRFQLDTGEFETIATSLQRSFSLEDIKEIYRLRWKIETSFNFLKHAVGLVNLHGRSDAFCEQEIYAALTMFNFASRISRQVIIRQPKDGMTVFQGKKGTTNFLNISDSRKSRESCARIECHIARTCLVKKNRKPSKRLSIKEIYVHSFFVSYRGHVIFKVLGQLLGFT